MARLPRGSLVLPPLLLLLAGCTSTVSTTSLVGRLRTEARRQEVSDARATLSRSRPFLRWDSFLLHRLEQLVESPDAPAAAALLEEAAALGLQVARQEARRLPRASVTGLEAQEGQEALLEALEREHQEALSSELLALEEARAGGRLGSYLRELRSDIDTPTKFRGRTRRLLAGLPLAPVNWPWLGWHILHEYRGPNDVDFDRVRVYAPPAPEVAGATDELPLFLLPTAAPDPEPQDPLHRFAPWIVQAAPAEPAYDPDADRLGSATLEAGPPGQARVGIDPARPAVYAYEGRALIGGEEYQQLIYTWWYPEHPPAERGDPEAGRIEGVTLRITLDGQGQPAIYESVYNCGCYHRVFVSQALEDRARAHHGEPLPGKSHSVEAETTRRIDLIVPEVFRTLGGTSAASLLDLEMGGPVPGAARGGGPVVFTFARFHMIGAVRPQEDVDLTRRAVEQVAYELRPYEDLELIPLDGGHGSIFQPDGLVRGAERREGFLLSGLGMLSAGQPRQRGTQLIHFDQYDLDDPTLLERFLRLPPGGL